MTYFEDIKERERRLFQEYSAGSTTAKADLMQSLAPVIYGQVNKFKGSGLPDIALELEAKDLAYKAIDTYDPTKAQLNTHVTNSLKKLSRFVMNYQNIGHIPEPRILMIGKYNTIFDNLEAELGREPTVIELSDNLQVSIAEVERLQSELRKDLSMTLQDDDDDGGFYFYAETPGEDPAARQAIEFVYYDADPIDKKIMEYRFGLSGVRRLSSKDIALNLKMSPSALKKRELKIAKEIRGLI